MYPFLFRIGPYPVPTYGIIAVLAFAACVLVMRRFAVKEGLVPGKVVDAIVLSIFIGLLGARLLEAMVVWRKIAEDPAHAKTLISSGGVFLGGLVSASLFVIWWCRRKDLPILPMLDILALVATMSMVVARWGCYFSGCCWGKPTSLPWGVTFPEIAHRLHDGIPQGPIHPTQIYLSLNSLLIFCVLVLFYRRKRFHGQIMLIYLALYAVTRFLIEYVRGDAVRGFVVEGLLSTSQFISVLLLVLAVALYPVGLRKGRV